METNETSLDIELITNVNYSLPTKFDTVSSLMHDWNKVSEKEYKDRHNWRAHNNFLIPRSLHVWKG